MLWVIFAIEVRQAAKPERPSCWWIPFLLWLFAMGSHVMASTSKTEVSKFEFFEKGGKYKPFLTVSSFLLQFKSMGHQEKKVHLQKYKQAFKTVCEIVFHLSLAKNKRFDLPMPACRVTSYRNKHSGPVFACCFWHQCTWGNQGSQEVKKPGKQDLSCYWSGKVLWL